MKKYIECFDQVSAVKKSIDGKDVNQSGDVLLRIYLRSRSDKDEICDRKLAYELQRMRSAVKKYINGELRWVDSDTGSMSPRGVMNCCAFICDREMIKTRLAITQRM